jgi:hypothetical protein
MSSRRRGTSVPTLQASPQALTRMLEEKGPINPALKLRMKAIFDQYEALVKLSSTRITTTRYRVNSDSAFDPAPNFLRGDGFDHVRTFSPLELISSALLICYHMRTRSDAQLLNDLKELRRHLRVKHKDLRVNAQCWTTAWEFIIGIKSPKDTSTESTDASDSDVALNKHLITESAQSEAAKKAKGTVIIGSSTGDKPPRTLKVKTGSFGNRESNNPSNNYSGTNAISALGQSGAGSDVNGGPNGTGQAKHVSVNAGSENRDPNTGISLRRSARSSVVACADTAKTTVGMSPRVTTGHNESTRVKNGTQKVMSRANTREQEVAELSDSSESLSSVTSSALNSPGPLDLPAHSRKRSLSDGHNRVQGARETKRSKV